MACRPCGLIGCRALGAPSARKATPGYAVAARGTVTLRHGGKLYHIGIGRARAGTGILLPVQDLHVRIVAAATGELLRELTLDRARNYQPTGKPRRPKKKHPDPMWVQGVLDVLRHHKAEGVGFEPTRTRQRPSGFQDRPGPETSSQASAPQAPIRPGHAWSGLCTDIHTRTLTDTQNPARVFP